MIQIHSSSCGTTTEKQRDYIKILSSYADTKDEDERDIENYLKKQQKKTISQLSKEEASELIKILLQRPAGYNFACGKKEILPKQEVNRYLVMGDFEGCLHACPDGINVNDCAYWKEHTNET